MVRAQTYKRAVVLFDLHVPQQDNSVVKIAKEFCADFKPHIVIAGGDWQNVGQVSTFANEDDIDLKDEFDEVKGLLDDFKVTHWLEGNHEERLHRVGLSNRYLRKQLDPVTNLELAEKGIMVKRYHRRKGVLKLGKLSVLHGVYTNEYVARATSQAYGCCMFGHAHRFQTHQPKHAFEKHTGFAVGCMCNMDLQYLENKPPRGWMQGFAFMYLLPNGNFSPYMVRIIGNDVVINGKVYSRIKK